MIYGSVCSGIEAASVAWHPLGWKPAFFSEIDAFPRAVLSHHFPEVPLHGDFTTIQAGDYRPIDLLVGGTPCQSFSIAGLRKGLDDDRGNLALEYLRLADRLRPKWVVWENVPGVLSSNGGRDFGALLGGLVELGYGFAYRVLDAQFFGVAQRRRRVFVVGYLGDWRPAAAVLFERHSLQGHPAPRRGQGTGTAAAAERGVDESGLQHILGTLCADTHSGAYSGKDAYTGRLVPTVNALTATGVGTCGADDNQAQAGHLVPTAYSIMPMNSGTDYKARETDIAQPVMTTPVGSNQGGDYVVQAIPIDTMNHVGRAVTHSFGDFEPGAPSYTLTKGHSHAVAYATFNDDGTARTLTARHDSSPCADRGPDVVAYGFDWQSGGDGRGLDLKPTVQLQAHQTPASLSVRLVAPTLRAGGNQTGGHRPPDTDVDTADSLQVAGTRVRRLTPTECERLQGFPDGWTQVPYRGKPAADGPRYKAIGNSMAVPVMAWIGQRIAEVNSIISPKEAA